MIFSDDNLRNLKNLSEKQWYQEYGIAALLARLEAAEKCCQFMWISEHPIDDSAKEAYFAWRKAAGK
jgi:hypothetical protein